MQEKESRPAKVSTALLLLWIALGLGIVISIITFSDSLEIATASGFGIGFMIVVSLVTLVILAFFIYLIGKGKNWARITFLILFVIGTLFSIPSLVESISASLISGILGISQIILQLIALILLFQKPSSDWFKSIKNTPSSF